MSYYFATQAALFEGSVEMTHRSGTAIAHLRKMIGEEAYQAALAAGTKQGREAKLTGESLNVRFRPKDRRQHQQDRGLGQMSGYELAQFEAQGPVQFRDGPVTVHCHRIEFDSGDDTLIIRGRDDQPAEIFDQRHGLRRLVGPRFEWNRTTGQIKALNFRIVGQ